MTGEKEKDAPRKRRLDTPPHTFSVAVVKAPSCQSYKTPMIRHQDTQWQCPNKECRQYRRATYVDGVYPFHLVKHKHEEEEDE